MNNVSFVGRLVADPELRQTPNGVSVCNFFIAVARNRNRDVADFFRCVTWKGSAEYLVRYGRKGALVAISGELINESYTDSSGNKREITKVNVAQFDILQTRSAEKTEPSEKMEPEAASVPETTGNDDLPF